MIIFGTDGWRGVIGEEYTFDNVRLVAAAIADYITKNGERDKGIVVGYDARFLSRQYAEQAAAVLAGKGVPVWLADSIMPTPALTWQVKDRQAAGGVMITASHNPAEYNGLKFKAPYGGSASPEIMAAIADCVRPLEVSGEKFGKLELPPAVAYYSPRDSYLEHVAAMLDQQVLTASGATVVFDMMHGGAMEYAAALARRYRLDLIEIRSEINPSFGGVNPEPIERNLAALRQAIAQHQAVLGLATDGDGDRIGAMDADGRFITSNQIIALLIKYLIEKRGWSGGVVKTLTVSELVRKTADKYRLKVYETPVGFKHVAGLMLSEDILIGGEESGGIGLKHYIPERDGLLLGFLLIEMAAAYEKTLGQLLDELMAEVGYFYYLREDLHLAEAQKQRLMARLNAKPAELLGCTVHAADCSDGCKFTLDDGWIMFRASGTEPIVRIYGEASTPERIAAIMQKAIEYARNA
ncbi:MAG: phosphoglucomutase/phosphomannomutase family protein [Sporomusaceae bacterium]|nr:phosphoglucomutase/phosphomannomutase family protein [Sporomusaceae bacterium]